MDYESGDSLGRLAHLLGDLFVTVQGTKPGGAGTSGGTGNSPGVHPKLNENFPVEHHLQDDGTIIQVWPFQLDDHAKHSTATTIISKARILVAGGGTEKDVPVGLETAVIKGYRRRGSTELEYPVTSIDIHGSSDEVWELIVECPAASDVSVSITGIPLNTSEDES